VDKKKLKVKKDKFAGEVETHERRKSSLKLKKQQIIAIQNKRDDPKLRFKISETQNKRDDSKLRSAPLHIWNHIPTTMYKFSILDVTPL
jgi:hypothetical protein